MFLLTSWLLLVNSELHVAILAPDCHQCSCKRMGLKCHRYEIRDITPPQNVKDAMEMQVEAERRKRALILKSEGQRQEKINIADGERQSVIFASEAKKQEMINIADAKKEAVILASEAAMKYQANRALGEAEAILSRQQEQIGGVEAASLTVAEQYVGAFKEIANEGTTMLLPSDTNGVANSMAQGMAMYKQLLANNGVDSKQ